ncbi:2-amino-4-hydroxy-6-hydroxymethyldihydropteridine diphosphokinase [Pauljensenia sp. UMB0895]|uniref:2-amino-4-hydroxy-6- hydroxymethyldihydropteridine diphosphokinase n=1 Tax=Pauljensenia sp. UMB0895 TaxID=3046319 RepID=UPI002551B645|nr:2-amino-4-hydroxy-6-hydroxymethyldihydropteridine diphosphokinase [Pauljensenia sp. UMB0895]MDK7337672.1 2-amino-4-hydroxy-6-hydroxymethyldihydropteridine diphosphokinase [Pauljensenia sp. UMB0895]
MSSPLDVITLRGLYVEAAHGVFDFEHDAPQPFIVDCALWVDTSASSSSDDIADTVSYALVADEITSIVSGPSVKLIETLGNAIARRLLRLAHVLGVEVTVHKPQAPLEQPFVDVSVTVRRGQVPLAVPSSASSSPDVSASAGVSDSARDRSFIDEAGHPGSVATGGDMADDDRLANLSESASVVDTDSSSPRPSALVPVLALDSEVDEVADQGEDCPASPVRVVLALGGNIGDVPSTFASAIEALIDDARFDVVNVSPILRTLPVLNENQEPQSDYWNAVVLVDTDLTPREVLDVAHELEDAAGRERSEHWGARTLDIDIVDYAGISYDDGVLVLPHIRAHSRAFVLAPWLMADSSAQLDGVEVEKLFNDASDKDGIIDAVEDWLMDPASVIAESDECLNATSSARVSSIVDFEETRSADAMPESESELRQDSAVGVDAESQTPRVPSLYDLDLSDLSVALAAPPTLEGEETRLDRMPAISRVNLQPDKGADDKLWNALWAKWSLSRADEALETVAEQDEADTQYQEESGDIVEVPELDVDNPVMLDQDNLVEGNETESESPVEMSDEASIPPNVDAQEESVADADADVHDDEETSAGEEAGRESEPVSKSTSSHRLQGFGRSLKWFPLFPRDEAQELNPTEDRVPENARKGEVRPTSRALPSWDFAHREVRIVDEPSPVDALSSSGAVQRRSIVDPQLPADALRGPIDDSEVTKTSIIRKLVVRPSSTGHIPLTKDQGE